MAVKFKLKRVGKKNQPAYRVIVIDGRKSTASGDYLDNVGTYNPRTKPVEIKLDSAKVKKWLSFGAQPTDTVARLFKKANVL